jgi:hypothetical protein
MSDRAVTECQKCRGLLVKETETLQGGGKNEVIKCVQCGNRAAERPAGSGMVREHAQSTTKQKPGAKPAPKKATNNKKAVRFCPECEREMPIVSRGLCGGCHGRLKKAGTLDEKYPAKKRGAQKGNRNNRPTTDKVAEAKPQEETEDQPLEIEVKPKLVKNPPQVDIKEAIRTVVEAAAPVGADQPETVTLEFNLSDERDVALLEKLETAAKTDRRTLPGEIMALLETVITDAA